MQTQPGLRSQIPLYLAKIEEESQSHEQQFQNMRQQFLQEAEKQIQAYFLKAKQQFAKHRKHLQKELTALQYYSQHPQQTHNLYPLFGEIDRKLIFNSHLIGDSQLKVSLPQKTTSELDSQVAHRKVIILQGYVRQLSQLVNSDALRKFCRKEFEQAQKTIKTYEGLLEKTKDTIYTPEIQKKGSFEEVVTELPQHRHLQKLSLALTTPNGILLPKHYHLLLDSLSQNRVFLTSLHLKVMDMEFSQEKCDIIRKRVPLEFKGLKYLTIHNYYKQCKLGLFEDFNWQPYRKQIHITAGAWS